MNQYAPKIVRKSRTQPMAIASIKALERYRAYKQHLIVKYAKKEVVFKTINPIPKHELVYDLIPSINQTRVNSTSWSVLLLFGTGYISYWIARVLYDEDTRYFCYVNYPREMKMLDDFTNNINQHYLSFKQKLPFKGEFPDLTQPENFNRFKRELKESLFGYKEKEEEAKIIDKKIKEDSKEFDSAVKDFTVFLNETDKKLQKIKIE